MAGTDSMPGSTTRASSASAASRTTEEIRRIVSDAEHGERPLAEPGRPVPGRARRRARRVRLWRVADGQAAPPRGTAAPARRWAFSPDSRQLAVGQDDWVLRFDLATGQEINRWHLPAEGPRVGLSPGQPQAGRRLRRQRRSLPFTTAPRAAIVADLPVGPMNHQVVAWHPDGARLAVAGSDPRIQIWDVAAQRKLATLEGHVQHVTRLSFHPDGDLLASRSWDGVAAALGSCHGTATHAIAPHRRLSIQQRRPVVGVACGKRRAGPVAGSDTKPRVPHPRQQLGRRPGRLPRRRHQSRRPPAGAGHGATASACGTWPAAGNWPCCRLEATRPLSAQRPRITHLSAPPDCTAGRFRTEEAANELRLGPPRTIALPLVPHRAARSPDGRTLAIVSETSGAGLLVDLTTESVRASPSRTRRPPIVALSRDGRWMASSGWHSDRVRLWNAQTGKMVHEWVSGIDDDGLLHPRQPRL